MVLLLLFFAAATLGSTLEAQVLSQFENSSEILLKPSERDEQKASLDSYTWGDSIGEGRYSMVYWGRRNSDGMPVAIKKLYKIEKERVDREIGILRELGGGPGIPQIYDVILDTQNHTHIVMQYVNATRWSKVVDQLSARDICEYLYQLLTSLEYAHRHDIIHRDLKPSNTLLDMSNRKVYLADWGLSRHFIPKRKYSLSVASRYYRSPELLLKMSRYNQSLDMWSYGCFAAGLIYRKLPFFKGKSDPSQLKEIAIWLGTSKMDELVKKYKLSKSFRKEAVLSKHKPRRWEQRINKENQEVVTETAIDFLSKILVYDPADRLTAAQALEHPYFQLRN